MSRIQGILSIPLVLFVACSTDPIVSDTRETTNAANLGNGVMGEFHPLGQGSWWEYDNYITTYLKPDGQPPEPPRELRETELRWIDGTEMRFGREYVLQTRFHRDESELRPVRLVYRYRQDRAGLYEADYVTPGQLLQPPGTVREKERIAIRRRAGWQELVARIPAEQLDAYKRAWDDLNERLDRIYEILRGVGSPAGKTANTPPGGVMSDELVRLSYPLHPGAHWVVRDEPLYAMTVVRHEVRRQTAAPMPAYKIRVESTLFGENDEVYVWYGRDGFAGWFVHAEGMATDPGGNPIGAIVTEDVLELRDFEGFRR